MLGGHKRIVKVLLDNGAKISAGDVGAFLCTAAEQNNLELLKDIVRHGGDVTLRNINRSTAIHIAVCEGNAEIVKFLLDEGASVDTPDASGWTARDLADQQGHEEIKQLFESHKGVDSMVSIPEERKGVRFLGRFKSDPILSPLSQDDGSWGRSRPRQRTNSNRYHNSLFGIISLAHTSSGDNNLLSPTTNKAPVKTYGARVIVSCPEKGDTGGKFVFLPPSFEELVDIGVKKYGLSPAKIRSKDGAEIDNIELVRDGDHLVFASE